MNEDQDYSKMKRALNIKGNERLPYREYVKQRTMYWIDNFATDDELDTLQTRLNLRRAENKIDSSLIGNTVR
jgi:hypothetical protein